MAGEGTSLLGRGRHDGARSNLSAKAACPVKGCLASMLIGLLIGLTIGATGSFFKEDLGMQGFSTQLTLESGGTGTQSNVSQEELLHSGIQWTNWDKRQVALPAEYLTPESEDALVNIVKRANKEGRRVKVVGAGHSFSPIAVTDGVVVSLDKYDRILDQTGSLITVQSGIRLKHLNRELEKRGLAMLNLGAVAEQSLAGAISTSTHGTGKHIGSVATSVRGFSIINGKGEVMFANTTHNVDLFHAGVVSLGALGIISVYTIECVPMYKLELHNHMMTVDAMFESLHPYYEKFERMQWYWTPYTDKATIVTRVNTTKSITGCWGQERKNPCVDVSYKGLTRPLATDAPRYTEMEMFIPVENASACIKDFRDYQQRVMEEYDPSVSLFTGVRYVAADDIWMSPMYQRATAVVSFIVRGDKVKSGDPEVFEKYARALETIATEKYQGRPHWGERLPWKQYDYLIRLEADTIQTPLAGKMNYVSGDYLRSVYPRYNDFRDLRAKMDPNNIFLNDYLQRVLDLPSDLLI